MRLSAILLFLASAGVQETPPESKGLEFFEKKIRPLLVENCYTCHSAQAEKLKGNLFLDTREGVLKGGDLGPAVVSGRPEKSLLLKAVRWVDPDLKMPPKQQLRADQIADLEAWVRMGLPDPRSKAAAAPPRKLVGMSLAEGRKFWSYRPLETAPVPEVRDARWPANEIDRFVLSRLEAEGLRPAPAAERDVLLRRLYYDLIGLPPSPDEVDAFVKDASADAVERVVDKLLVSPHFGERWGRHWLDVARFAESLTLRGFILKEAWRYRDYVIDAFNSDLPYDRFIREQIAGDLIDPIDTRLAERRRRLVAVTFLTLGNSNLEEQDKKQLEMDVVDEQLEAVGRAFMAQTIGCARCHDHKFDPIPTRDYYALAGILRNARMLEHANVSKWIEAPLPDEPAREAEIKTHEEAVAALQARIKAEKAKASAKGAVEKPKGVLAVADVAGIVVDDAKAVKVGIWQASTHSGTYIGDGYVHDLNDRKGESSLTFQPELVAGKYEVRFAYSHGTSRSEAVPVTILSAEGEKIVMVNQQEAPPIDGRFVSLGQFRFENNQGYAIVSNDGTKGHVTADLMAFIPAGKAPVLKADVSDTLGKMEAELKRLQKSGPKREMAMAVKEEKKLIETRIHVRGSVHTLGDPAPRGFLQVAVSGDLPPMPSDQSGRKELAEWLANRDNPLAARVMANRVWHWIFGAGIVQTTDNFGTTGMRPSHPELLDHLALRFIEDGWSIKKLIRRIVTSSAYRMSSAKAGETDPENRLLWKMNRRRMDAESIRDTLLSVSGQLKLDPGGPAYPDSLSSDYGYKHAETRRSVYVPVFRNALPELFEVFDFADTSVPTGRREISTVAPQALFLMNSPFVHEHSRHAAARLLAEKHPDDRSRIARAWRLSLGRLPTEAEAGIALRHLAKGGESWASLFHALFSSVEFRYVD